MRVPCGIWLLTGIDSGGLTVGVYLLVGLLAIMGLARIRLPMGEGRAGAWLVGGSSGALIAAFSIGGPLVVAWLSHCGLRARVLRATLIMFFLRSILRRWPGWRRPRPSPPAPAGKPC